MHLIRGWADQHKDAVPRDISGDSLHLTGAAAVPRVNRVEIFADDEIQVFHLVNRCVRSTYLCGRDEEPGRDYSHRRPWKSMSNVE